MKLDTYFGSVGPRLRRKKFRKWSPKHSDFGSVGPHLGRKKFRKHSVFQYNPSRVWFYLFY